MKKCHEPLLCAHVQVRTGYLVQAQLRVQVGLGTYVNIRVGIHTCGVSPPRQSSQGLRFPRDHVLINLIIPL